MKSVQLFDARMHNRLAEEGVVTHFGDDLDNRFTVEALRRHFGLPEIKVDRTPAGKPVSGRINIDVGDESCTEPITVREDGTIVIDHHFSGKKNTLQILQENGVYVPAQAIEFADTPTERQVDPLDYRSGLALARHMSGDQLWRVAEEGLLTATLNDQQLEAFGLEGAAAKQKAVVDTAVQKVNEGVVPGTKAVVMSDFVPGGSQVAYRLGYDVYASVSPHKNGGTTFAVTARPGTKLPEGLLALARSLQAEHGNGVFVKPDETMVVAGGPKNPAFAIPVSKEEMVRAIKATVVAGECIHPQAGVCEESRSGHIASEQSPSEQKRSAVDELLSNDKGIGAKLS